MSVAYVAGKMSGQFLIAKKMCVPTAMYRTVQYFTNFVLSQEMRK